LDIEKPKKSGSQEYKMAIFSSIVMYIADVLYASIPYLGYGAATMIGYGVVAVAYIGVVSLMVQRPGAQSNSAVPNSGTRIQLPPATNNKLPVVYGTAYIAPSVVDAIISTDLRAMTYVLTLAEVTDTTPGSGYTFDEIYYDGKLVTFDFTDHSKVASLTTNSNPAQTDTKISPHLHVYLYSNGSSSGVNTTHPAWYHMGGWDSNYTMSNCCFMIVNLIYNVDSGTTGLGSFRVKLSNNLTKPGDVFQDYLTNPRYGCAVPITSINTATLAEVNAYSDQLITYTSSTGFTTSTQARYRIHGPMDTNRTCMENLQYIADACDSWIQFSEVTGQWGVVLNRSYTDYTTLTNLYQVYDNTLIGGIDINPTDLNSTYNQMEIQYPNTNIMDQTDIQVLDLYQSDPALLSPNEPVNKFVLQLPLVNNAVQAKYLGARRLLLSREDLVISFRCDYSGIQVNAGDVIRINHNRYGWIDKLFRVTNVTEEKAADGSLSVTMLAGEYNESVYADLGIIDYVPSANQGVTDPNVFVAPAAPTIVPIVAANNAINAFTVIGVLPVDGTYLYMDFNYGTTTDVSTHILYQTVKTSNGTPLTPGGTYSVPVTDLPAGTYYWSLKIRNNMGGIVSTASTFIAWIGPTVASYNTGTGVGGITTGVIHNNAATETYYYYDSNARNSYFENVIDQQFDLTSGSNPNLYLTQSTSTPVTGLLAGYSTWYDTINHNFHFYDATSAWKLASGSTLSTSSLYAGDIFYISTSNTFYTYHSDIAPNGWYPAGVEYTRDTTSTTLIGVGPFSTGGALDYGAKLDFTPEADATCIITIMASAYVTESYGGGGIPTAYALGVLMDVTTGTAVSSAPHSGISRGYSNIQSTTPQIFSTQWTTPVTGGHNYRVRVTAQTNTRYCVLTMSDIQIQAEVIKK
jgi:hypothetical protein